MIKPYKKIQIPIGHEDIRMFQELVDYDGDSFTWTFDEIDVEFIKDTEENSRLNEILSEADVAMNRFIKKITEERDK